MPPNRSTSTAPMPRRCSRIDDGRSRQGRGDRRAPAQTRPVSSRRGPDAGEGNRECNRRTESTADHRRQQVVAGGSGTRIGTGANRTQALTAGIVGTGRKLVHRTQAGRLCPPTAAGRGTNHQDGGITDLWKGLRYKQDRRGRVQDATLPQSAGCEGRQQADRDVTIARYDTWLCRRAVSFRRPVLPRPPRGDGVRWPLRMERTPAGCFRIAPRP